MIECCDHRLSLTFNLKCICLRGTNLFICHYQIPIMCPYVYSSTLCLRKADLAFQISQVTERKELSGGDSKENVNLHFKIKNKIIIPGNKSFLFFPTLQFFGD